MLRVGGLMLKALLAQPLPLRPSSIPLSSLLTSSRSASNPNSNLSSNSNSGFIFGRRQPAIRQAPPTNSLPLALSQAEPYTLYVIVFPTIDASGTS